MKENVRNGLWETEGVWEKTITESVRSARLMERGGTSFSPTALFSYNVANQFPSQNALCERFYIVCLRLHANHQHMQSDCDVCYTLCLWIVISRY